MTKLLKSCVKNFYLLCLHIYSEELSAYSLLHANFIYFSQTSQSHRAAFPHTLPLLDGKGKISDLQHELMFIVAGATDDTKFFDLNVTDWTEAQAASYCREKMNAYFNMHVV